MDQDETQVVEGTTPAEEPALGPILGTKLIRVTFRDDPAGADDRPSLPTNDAATSTVEEAFRAQGFAYVNATAENV